MIRIDKYKINTYILALYVFQFGLVLPLVLITNSQWPIAAATISLTLIMLINNSFKINNKAIFTFTIISIYFFINALVIPESTLVVLSNFMEFIIKCYTAFLIGGLKFDREEVYEAFLKVSILNFITLIGVLILGMLDDNSYMRYGYAMLPSAIMLLYACFTKERFKLLWMLLSLLSFSITMIYGSRGPLLVFALLMIIIFIFSTKLNANKKIIILSSFVLIIYIIIKFNLLVKFLNFIYFDIGVQTYSLEKLIMMINVGLVESSSGRGDIYLSIWNLIKENSFFGYGIGYSQVKFGYTAHNLFLQIILESGIVGFMIWLIIWYYCLLKFISIYRNDEIGLFKIATLIIVSGLGRLLVSSDLWLRTEYWLALSILINYKSELNSFRERYL